MELNKLNKVEEEHELNELGTEEDSDPIPPKHTEQPEGEGHECINLSNGIWNLSLQSSSLSFKKLASYVPKFKKLLETNGFPKIRKYIQ